MTGRLQATYYFSGSESSPHPSEAPNHKVKRKLKSEIGSAQISTSSTFSGPTDSVIVVTEKVPANETIWSVCQDPLPLNINMQLVLNDDGTGDSNSTAPSSLYESGFMKAGVMWRSC